MEIQLTARVQEEGVLLTVHGTTCRSHRLVNTLLLVDVGRTAEEIDIVLFIFFSFLNFFERTVYGQTL